MMDQQAAQQDFHPYHDGNNQGIVFHINTAVHDNRALRSRISRLFKAEGCKRIKVWLKVSPQQVVTDVYVCFSFDAGILARCLQKGEVLHGQIIHCVTSQGVQQGKRAALPALDKWKLAARVSAAYLLASLAVAGISADIDLIVGSIAWLLLAFGLAYWFEAVRSAEAEASAKSSWLHNSLQMGKTTAILYAVSHLALLVILTILGLGVWRLALASCLPAALTLLVSVFGKGRFRAS